MAVPKLSMPSFNFTRDEKVDNENHVHSLIHQSLELLSKYKKKSSIFDLLDAYSAIEDALAIAKDPGACEFSPLAKCYLSQAHILKAMGQYQEACNTYRQAARAPSRNPLDRAASQQAAEWAAQMDQKIRDAKRKGGIWPDIYQQASSTTDPTQLPSEIIAENIRGTDIYFAHPLLKEVNARQPCIETPNSRNPQRSQNLIPCHDGWISDAMSNHGFDHRGMLLPTSPVRSFKEHLAVRNATEKNRML